MKTYAYSHYLSPEASQARTMALLERIETECRASGAAEFNTDLFRLPKHLRDEVYRRLLCPS